MTVISQGEWEHFWGKQSYDVFPHLVNRDQLLEKRICSSRSKFFSLGVDSILGGVHPSGRQTENHESCTLSQNAEKA